MSHSASASKKVAIKIEGKIGNTLSEKGSPQKGSGNDLGEGLGDSEGGNKHFESIAQCLARNIRHHRLEQGMTQAQLASAAKLSFGFLQNIESGRRWAGAPTIDAIAEALNIQACDLFAPVKAKAQLRNVPKDILQHLDSTCRSPHWRWETLRLIFEGFISREQTRHTSVRLALKSKLSDH